MKNTVYDIVVVGGGASGMMAAITAARGNKRVLILEHMEVLGKKILATGNGRCNFTNTIQGPDFYRSGSPAFVMPSLNVFSATDTISFFEELGVMVTDRAGYCYPRTMQASLIRNVLLAELDRLGVKILTQIGIRQIKKAVDAFLIETKSGNYMAKRVILAAGGKADPKSGSDGSGYIYAKQLGHSLTETVPALVPLISNAGWLKEAKGVRQDARVTVYIQDEAIFSDQGEVQFTDYGISGIPVFQISRFAAKALFELKKVTVSIDFVPDLTREELTTWIEDRLSHYQKLGSCFDILCGIMNQKLVSALKSKIAFLNSSLYELSEKQKKKMIDMAVSALKDTKIDITDTKPFMQAQVTAGGVDVASVEPATMESKLVKGLYFAGEILDVDGMCGGYNLQWAWTSGFIAGTHAARSLDR